MNKPDFFNLYLELPANELEWELDPSIYLVSEEISYLINPRRLREVGKFDTQ